MKFTEIILYSCFFVTSIVPMVPPKENSKQSFDIFRRATQGCMVSLRECMHTGKLSDVVQAENDFGNQVQGTIEGSHDAFTLISTELIEEIATVAALSAAMIKMRELEEKAEIFGTDEEEVDTCLAKLKTVNAAIKRRREGELIKRLADKSVPVVLLPSFVAYEQARHQAGLSVGIQATRSKSGATDLEEPLECEFRLVLQRVEEFLDAKTVKVQGLAVNLDSLVNSGDVKFQAAANSGAANSGGSSAVAAAAKPK